MVKLNKRNYTKNERKWLAQLEKSNGQSITEISQQAGVPLNTYYRMIKKPHFREMLPEMIQDRFASLIVPVIDKVGERALAGSAKHAQLILEGAGIIGGQDGVKIQIINGKDSTTRFLSESEAKSLLSLLEVKKDEHARIKEGNPSQRALPPGEGSED